MRFQSQHVVVTGGTRGIGAGVTRAFLAEGAIVHATYRADDASAEALREDLGADGERLQLARLDVTSPEGVAAFWTELADTPVSVLVNNAGIRRDSLLATMSEEEWESVLATNLSGAYRMSREAVRNMLAARYGRIVMITSPAGRVGFEGQGNYAASKAGLVGMARALAKEVARKKITVNCVSPGFVDTELLSDLSEDQAAAYKKSVPMRRFGTPAEVASAVLYLASPQASYVSGSLLEVAGGL